MMIETTSRSTKATWNPIKLDHFLAQVQALVEMHNLQKKELEEAKSALREAQLELNQRERSSNPQMNQPTEEADLQAALDTRATAHSVPEDENLAFENHSNAGMKWDSLSDIPGSKSIYSPQPHQPQDLRAFDPNMVQKLLEEINSCIALLEE